MVQDTMGTGANNGRLEHTMDKKNTKLHLVSNNDEPEEDDFDEMNEYSEMELLEQLESLREDMEDLKVTTLAEVIERISELHRQLDK
ncbi:hypothetical protein KDA_39300 [Dictyobacter alpinus]|uniref:Uncharacterized protein n=2 Tax=Dictyobacter alpinus TaxID=2014873 RepID=A0A402BAW3_9CHLR|nr:hypothetical protein KDA_39300 [Dictyobacter alpinus]